MPKRVGYIYQKMADPDFIRSCIRIGSKDSKKKRRRDVKAVLSDMDGHVAEMAEIVNSRSFRPRKPHSRTIYDASSQKYRNINSVPFWPDGLMHVMVTQAMKDVMMRGMDPWSCASIPGRGGARIRKRIQQVMRRDVKGTKYAAELDIKSYYDSIPLEKLMAMLERKIKDKEFLLLVAIVITCTPITLGEAKERGFGWREIVGGDTGLLIGFYINQWLANFYLEPLDRLLNRSNGIRYHTRHMDNLVFLGSNKRKLHRGMRRVMWFLNTLGLRIKSDWQLFATAKRLIAAVGYRFGRGYTILRKRNFLRLARQSRRIQKRIAAGRLIAFRQASGFISRIGQLNHCDSFHARTLYVVPANVAVLKQVIRIQSQMLAKKGAVA